MMRAQHPPCSRSQRLAAVLALSLVCGAANGDELAEIVTGCHHSNAEWGNEMIDRCIRENTAIREQVLRYPAQHQRIVNRCRQATQWGWEYIKKCVDEDIAAEAALTEYPKEKGDLLAACNAEFGGRGAAKVKACVDGELPIPRATEQN